MGETVRTVCTECATQRMHSRQSRVKYQSTSGSIDHTKRRSILSSMHLLLIKRQEGQARGRMKRLATAMSKYEIKVRFEQKHMGRERRRWRSGWYAQNTEQMGV